MAVSRSFRKWSVILGPREVDLKFEMCLTEGGGEILNMELPLFKYHPDPISTGSIKPNNIQCVCCGNYRVYVYVGPVYARAELNESICPWCIADGSAHEKFRAEFNDKASVGGYSYFTRKSVSQDVKEEIAYRTPGFNGWQQERWLVHCNDGCEFLGPAGKREIEAFDSKELLESLRTDVEMDEEEFKNYLNQLDRDSSPTAYIFRCLHCGKYMGYSDFD
jgi:uncharacterized protein